MENLKKDDLRRKAIDRRNALTPKERDRRSAAICSALIDDELFLAARAIHVYLPFGTEVDINPVIEVAWGMGKEVGLMRVMEDGGIAHHEIDSGTTYRKGSLGIMEPVDSEPFNLDHCDLVIVPVVAADSMGNRLGYGKGYYDQFLSHYPRPAIGVCFEEQIFDSIPHDDGDIVLDAIYTDRRVIVPDDAE